MIEAPLLPDLFYEFGSAPLVFQMGVPSQDAFPFKLWSRILARETRRAAAAPVTYPDPRGDPELRKEIAAYLGLARGIRGPSGTIKLDGERSHCAMVQPKLPILVLFYDQAQRIYSP